jgi:acetoin utilization protein AcuB
MRVRDVMSRVVLTISASQSCYEAALRMSRLRVHHLPVLAEDGRLAGVVTDRDLRAELFLAVARATEASPVDVEQVLRQRRVHDVMSAPPVTVAADERLTTAVTVMAERRVGSLPVLERDRLVGIVTDADVLRLLSRRRLFGCAEVEAILLPAA